MTRPFSSIALLAALALPGCGFNDKPETSTGSTDDVAEAPQKRPEQPSQRGTVRFIRLPESKPALPEGQMRDIVLVQCGMCHTPQYITLQPPLSREQWHASVTKMRTTYGGPIPEEQVEPIVDYLVAANGAK